ncbi:hypothetical protein VCR12J2_80014 [Vibrio coralliirubri]|nr:hypothetical protein VCR12J2_80014 [Vibrio coralliirubri]
MFISIFGNEKSEANKETMANTRKFRLSSTTLHQLLFGNSKFHIVPLSP